MANMKATTVRAPEGFLEAAKDELGFATKQEMLLELVKLALTQRRQRISVGRILELGTDLPKLLDKDFRARARG
ncbi:hypothetical protein AB0H49_15690 [Nocardia sp. NPDC050713]|uniref:hypothetical protein n=1 Tax=Nocardia TaxID=1817 RepID=UPI0012ED0ECF|nr:hypothetical protein [Nocardia amikacinitolerans]